jgi:Ca2+-binding EF-hand superfamily protein
VPVTSYAQSKTIVYYDEDFISKDGKEKTAIGVDYQNIPTFFLKQLHNNLTRERFVLQTLSTARIYAGNKEEFTKEDVALEETLLNHAVRHDQMSKVIRFDLNFDGRITEAEVKKTFEQEDEDRPEVAESKKRQRTIIVEQLKALDTNEDKVITYQEMTTLNVDSQHYKREGERFFAMSQLLEMDENKDGKAHISEIQKQALNAFNVVDIDKDGIISRDEHRFMQESATYQSTYQQKLCKFGDVPKDVRFVVIGLDSAQTISTADPGAKDLVTTIADLEIKTTDKPVQLYLVSKQPIIWNISGNIAGLERVYLTTKNQNNQNKIFNNGVINVPKEKVHFLNGPCLRSLDDRSIVSSNVTITQSLGRSPNLLGAGGRSQKIRLHDDRVEFRPADPYAYPPIEGGDAMAMHHMKESYSGGIRTVKAENVVSNVIVKEYSTLAGELGIHDLVQKGKLRKLGHNLYEILEPIDALPAGLHERPHYRFKLRKGVPAPKGQLQWTCFIVDPADRAAVEKSGVNICKENAR